MSIVRFLFALLVQALGFVIGILLLLAFVYVCVQFGLSTSGRY